MSQKRSTKSKPKLKILTQPYTLRVSPKIVRIKSNVKSERTSEEIPGKIGTPKPRIFISNSPIISSSHKSYASKLTPLRMISTHRILSKKPKQIASQIMKNESPNNLSISLPAPQNFKCLIEQLLGIFDSAESLTDYFFMNRKSPLMFEDFYQSCRSLKIDQFYPDLEKIFEEGRFEKILTRKKFCFKVISIQNKFQSNDESEKIRFSEIVKKIYNKENDAQMGTKKLLGILKETKGADDLIARIQMENFKVKLSSREVVYLLNHRAPVIKKKQDLNLTVNLKPYTVNVTSLMPKSNL